MATSMSAIAPEARPFSVTSAAPQLDAQAPMRIGYDTLVENPLNPSSAINYLKSVLWALVEVGPQHEFFVFVSPKNRHLFQVDAPNVHLVNCGYSNENIPLRILAQQLYYPILAKRHRLDVIHALSQIPLLAPCATVAKICGLHHHIVPGEYLRAQGRRLSHPLRLLYRRVMWDASARRATLVMANSSATRDGITRHMGVPPERVRVVFESVDDAFGKDIDREEAARTVRAEFALERPYVLYVSNLWFYKNPDGAIRGFARQVEKFGDDMDLVIAGPDDYNRIPELKRLAAERGVEQRLRFLGRVPYRLLLKLYSAARVVFYPSLAETFGKPVIEGMRAGVPVVAARATSLPELVADAGLLIDPLDEDSAADALHLAATDESVRRTLIERGVARGQEFSWAATARGTLALCGEATRAHRGRR
jgi:glycosyltransferase involved in cell wall biosynthesis